VLVDRKTTDIRVEAAMAKMFGTEVTWDVAYEAMQTVGGRGYETEQSLRDRGEQPFYLERVMRDVRINTIFEGSSEIMRLFLAREALDPHLKVAGEAINPKLPTGRRMKAALKAGLFYAWWYPRQWLPLGAPSTAGMDAKLARQVRYVARTKRKLARRLFHAMMRLGPKLERQQMLLGRFVEIGTELFAISATCSRAQHLISEGKKREEVVALAEHFCRQARIRVANNFNGVGNNNDDMGYRLAQEVLGGSAGWLFEDTVKEREVEREMAMT
jgi:alkylation response protein AidB-like acyl-CoA dehydrogenase